MGAMGSAPPGAAPPPAVPQPEPLAAPASADPALAAATPPPVPGESLDATEFRDAADGALAEHDIDDATLERAEEGPLHAIGADKRELNEAVDSAADRARGQEATAIGTAESALSGAETQAEGAMEGGREAAQTAVIAEQDATRGGEQTGEQTLADSITGIYSRAETSVSERLGSLQSDAVERFRSAQAERLAQFASGVRSDLDAFKRQRYAGAEGLYYQARDWLLSINSVPAVQALYERHRSAYIAAIDQLLATIRTDIEATIADCRRTLAAARSEIDALVKSQRGSLDAEAQAALNRATAQFAAMESRIETTRRNALAALDAERTRAIAEMDRALEEIRAENAGLVDRIASAIAALAAALGEFMALLARVTRMGVGAFLSAALGQARDGVQNHLWDQLQEAFKQWIFMKLPVLQLLLNLPPNWLAMLTALSLSLIGLFTDSLPALLPAIGVAAMVWLATTLAAKLIPGVGAIMAVIDAIRGAWSLVQSLFSAAGAFLQFVMKVAEPAAGAGVAFAQALAHGIVGAVDAILIFLGVDQLIRRVVGAIARPFGRIIQRIQTRFSQWQQRRRQRRSQARDRDRRRDGGRENPADANRHRRAEDAARRDRRAEARRRQTESERHAGRSPTRQQRQSDRRQERERAQRERLERRWRAGMAAVEALVNSHRDEAGISTLRFRAELLWLRARYRFSSLTLEHVGDGFLVVARMNPSDRRRVGGHLIDINRIPFPPGESASTSRKDWGVSNRGNTRLFLIKPRDSETRAFVFVARGTNRGNWQAIPGAGSGGEAERLARQHLEATKEQYIALVPADRHPAAPGFDAAGVGRDPGSPDDRLYLGEAKESTAGRYFTARGTSAFHGSPFRTNIRRLLSGSQPGIDAASVRTALEAGRVTYQVFLRGNASYSERQRRRLENLVKTALRAYLRSRGLSRDQIAAAIQNVHVPPPIRL